MTPWPAEAGASEPGSAQRVRRSLNALDIIVIAVIALSALFAFARGFVKEALSIAAWVGAGLITLYGLPALRPVAQKYITTPLLADAVAGVTLFVVSLGLGLAAGLLAVAGGSILIVAADSNDKTLPALGGALAGAGATMVGVSIHTIATDPARAKKPALLAM